MNNLVWHQIFSNYHNIKFKPNGKTEKIRIKQNLSGDKIQVELSNEYDGVPLKVETIKISLREDFKEGTLLTFNGEVSFDIPPLSRVWTDLVDFKVPPKQDLYFEFRGSNERNLLATSANLLSRKILCTNITEQNNFLYGLTAVKLFSKEKNSINIGFFGDSLTNQGYFSDQVLQTLYQVEPSKNFTGFNVGISGNRLLLPGTSISEWRDSFGEAGIKRFEKDVFKYSPQIVVVLIGLNDLFHPGTGSPIEELPSAESMIKGYEYLSNLADQKKMIFVPLTLPPFKGGTNGDKESWSMEKEKIRQGVNQKIRTYKNYIDADDFVKNPLNRMELNPIFDSGDHLHFSEAGGVLLENLSLKN